MHHARWGRRVVPLGEILKTVDEYSDTAQVQGQRPDEDSSFGVHQGNVLLNVHRNRTAPGLMSMTFTPWWRRASWQLRLQPRSPHLHVEYTHWAGVGRTADMLPMLMIRPSPLRTCRKAVQACWCTSGVDYVITWS